jgi:tetratricopeptide (TPR) repeat protein
VLLRLVILWHPTHSDTFGIGARLGSERGIVTQEFLLSVTHVQDDKYIIRTEHQRMSTGVPIAEEIVTWEVDAWMNQAAVLMNDPLVGLLRSAMSDAGAGDGAAANPIAESSTLSALGRQLYNAIFQGSIRDSWIAAQGIAQNQQDILRLRLGLKDDRAIRLPWEVLHAGDRPLATGTDVVFSRYLAGSTPPFLASGTVGQPLRILMVLSAPTDQDRLQLHDEATHLQDELAHDRALPNSPEIELTILEQPGREQITQSLEQGNYDILHYAGHSGWGAAGGDLYLVNRRTGLTEPLSGEDLAGLLVNNGVRMAVFNSCRGVRAATAESAGALDNLADALLRRGVPAILAMAERIPDDVALILSRLFYRNLKQGYPIDLSLNRARQGLLSSYGSNQLYWALPILYLHPEFDGYLHAVPGQSGGVIDTVNPLDPMLMDLNQLPMDDFESFLDPALDPDYADDRSTIADLMKGLEAPAFVPSGSNATPVSPVDDLLQLGQRLQDSGDLTGAIDAYGQALKLDGNNAIAYDALGTAFQQYGNLPEALASYRMASQLDPILQSAQDHAQAMLQGNSGAANSVANSAASAANFGSTDSARTGAVRSTVAPWKKPASIAIAGLAAIGLGVAAHSLSRQSQVFNPEPSSGSLSSGDAKDIVAIAQKGFGKDGDMRKSQEAITTLLDQDKLVQAQEALGSASGDQQNIAPISYLRGRLGWQFMQKKMGTHSIDDVRRYWALAVQKDANNAQYQNALGFAYYSEGNYNGAADAWTHVIKIKPNPSDLATAEAGIALVYWQKSLKGGKDTASLKAKAIEFRDRVLKARPTEFSDDMLSKNWLWTEQMIGDWKKLRSL